MKTIRKQTADLKFGDVVFSSSRPDVVFVRFLPSPPLLPGMARPVEFFVELLERDGTSKSAHFPASVEVVLNLTPAQQHADELLALVRAQVTKPQGASGFEYDAQKLLDKIDPPKPPTLDEALSMLDEIMRRPGMTTTQAAVHERCDRANKLLDRARRSGVLS